MKENDISNQGSLFSDEKPQKISLQESSNHICKSLPDGLRHVVVYADINSSFPPIPNSHLDIDLLRAANQALKRNTKLNSDVFLFIINDSKKRDKVNALKGEGAPICVDTHASGGRGSKLPKLFHARSLAKFH